MIDRNKKIFITGGDGFIGSHLTEHFLKEGYSVRAMAMYNSFGSWGWLEDADPELRKNLEVVSGDIRDERFVRDAMKDVGTVFHLAALIAIPYSYNAPKSYIETNIIGTYNVCQAALDHKVQRVVITSTSEVYGTAQFVPISESHPLQPQSPYSASKIGADAIALSFHNSFELPLTVARPFNTYGPRQSARAIIPTIITQIANGYKQINLGDLTPTRDFNYVSDVCLGFAALADCDAALGKVVNIGSNIEISLNDTFSLIKRLMKTDVELVLDKSRLRPANSEVFRLCCDNKLLQQLTGFVPPTGFEQGLMKTIEWFTQSENLKKYKAFQYNV